MNWHWLNLFGVALSLIAIACDPIPAGKHHINPFRRNQQTAVYLKSRYGG